MPLYRERPSNAMYEAIFWNGEDREAVLDFIQSSDVKADMICDATKGMWFVRRRAEIDFVTIHTPVVFHRKFQEF